MYFRFCEFTEVTDVDVVVDDVIFITWDQWARIKHDVRTLYFEGVRQMAIPVERKTATVFDRVH